MSSKELPSNDKGLSQKQRKRKLIVLIPLILIFGSLTLLSILYFDEEKIIEENISSLEHSDELSSNETNTIDSANTEIIISNVDSLASNKIDSTSKIDTLINISIKDVYSLKELQPGFLVVIGAFKDKVNAIHMRDQTIQKLNANCKVVFNDISLYWVSLGFYNSKDEAVVALNNYGFDGWIKKI